MAKAPAKESFSITGPAGELEALLECPQSCDGLRIAVLCHPHPQHQGTMLNKVIHTLARAMTDMGVPALRFNFRGTGASEGEYGGGIGELDDLACVVAYVRRRWPEAELWLGGFSFGAVVSARAATTLEAARLISIAPAVNILGQALTETPTMPWLVIHGDADDVVPADEVIEWVTSLDPRPELLVLPGAGHFFHGQLVVLRELLVEWLARTA
ncbi:MAG: alpha/beta hydrolase [Gammaproteobacteria bacterium]|nr:MAG: alpha/beta hydrolase [Gammaproteobacteria bacterium]